jgi:hypothetical protein
MNTNIEISRINKHFHVNKRINEAKDNRVNDNNVNDEDDWNDDNSNSNKYTTKITDYCFSSINEANITDKIKNILYYSNNYSVFEDYDFMNVSSLNDDFIEKLDLSNNKRYLIFKYKKEDSANFNEYLLHFTDPKLFVLNVIESFSYILKGLIKLTSNKICFFNLSPENIVFNLDRGENPILHNFQLSLLFSKLNEEYITNIIKEKNDYTYKPLEVHILFYFIHNEILTISYSFIEEVCESFVNNLRVLDLFSLKYKESYKNSCIETMKKYINKPKKEIILSILKDADKWDAYSLSLIYLQIFGHISRVFSLKQNFISKITLELSKNIHPDPSKRCNLEKLLENYNKLFISEKNWSFVDNMDQNKMSELIDILEI